MNSINNKIIDDYYEISTLGNGSFGKVYKSKDIYGNYVTIKKIKKIEYDDYYNEKAI